MLYPIVDSERLAAFGRQVATLRRGTGMSQQDLGVKAGLHRTYIGGVERGERNISLLNIHRLAEALGISIIALFEYPHQ